jgi:hypothetical protein
MHINFKSVVITLVLFFAGIVPVMAQEYIVTDSVGRGWPLPIEDEVFVGAAVPFWNQDIATAKGGDSPDGITSLARDIYNSDDFYKDKESWLDPRYYRCNSPLSLDTQWGNYSSGPKLIVNDNPITGAWGNCDIDYPREKIVSPYPFKTAQEHYEALMAEAEAKGGPTIHDKHTLPDWNGNYSRNVNLIFSRSFYSEETLETEFVESPQWTLGHVNQMPTILSLLTETYQQRFVQQMYHMSRGNSSQWSLMYCRPEGFMRAWSGPGFASMDVTVVPDRVQLLIGSGNAIRNININREFEMGDLVPHLGSPVRNWYGESIGFWDGETLITWSSNIQGWFTHASWEHSDFLQTIEIFTARKNDAGEFIGLEHEAIFYDPEVFVEPVRAYRFLPLTGPLNESSPINFSHCNQTIYPVDGKGVHVTPGMVIEYKIPNLYDRPWAEIYENYHEEGMEQPAPTVDIFAF